MELTGAATAPQTSRLLTIPGGIEGVKYTLGLMVNMVRTFKTDLNVRTYALGLVKPCTPKDAQCELVTLQRFVRDSIDYRKDVDGVETVQTPVQTLRLEAGDCDDKATLFCALAASIGYATRFLAIGVRGEPFSHVLPQVVLGNSWVPAEVIIPGAELGWFPPDATVGMTAHN